MRSGVAGSQDCKLALRAWLRLYGVAEHSPLPLRKLYVATCVALARVGVFERCQN